MKKTPPKGVVNYVIYDKVNYIIPSATREAPLFERLLACIAPAGAYHRVFDAPLAL